MFDPPFSTNHSPPFPTTFLNPYFTKSIDGKVHKSIALISPGQLQLAKRTQWFASAIATQGFSSHAGGVYVFAMNVKQIVQGNLMVGFTNTPIWHQFDEDDYNEYQDDKHQYRELLPGVCLHCCDGSRSGARGRYLPLDVTQTAKEIISILTISADGHRKNVRWVVDGIDGDEEDCSQDFEIHYGQENEIFPYVALGDHGQLVESLSFDRVQMSSPILDQLLEDFQEQKTKMTPPALPSTSTADNDALISQLRIQISRRQEAAIKDREEIIDYLREQMVLHAHERRKDQTHRAEIETKNKMLELERTEHQKTRNLLHQIKMELKDMEIYYLLREKEAGQRRQREEENDQFKVKEEPE